MKVIPIVENKIKIEFENGETIEVYESPNGNGIIVEYAKILKHSHGRFYKIVPAGGGEK